MLVNVSMCVCVSVHACTDVCASSCAHKYVNIEASV